MTNKEIKLELARIALERCNFTTSETLTESLKNLYEWVIEEPEVEVKENAQNEYDNITVSEILKLVRENTGTSSRVTESLAKVFYNNNITTVEDLLKVGKMSFKRYRNIGKKSLSVLDDALFELGIKSW